MDPSVPLTVTTSGGVAVTFDPVGNATTHPEFPPEVLRVQELAKRLQPVIDQAAAAYRAAKGEHPPEPRALLPYFTNEKDAVDYLELAEAWKTAEMDR